MHKISSHPHIQNVVSAEEIEYTDSTSAEE